GTSAAHPIHSLLRNCDFQCHSSAIRPALGKIWLGLYCSRFCVASMFICVGVSCHVLCPRPVSYSNFVRCHFHQEKEARLGIIFVRSLSGSVGGHNVYCPNGYMVTPPDKLIND